MTQWCRPAGCLGSAIASTLLFLFCGPFDGHAAPLQTPGVTLTPASHAFPWETVGGVSSPLTFTLSNTTQAVVSISGISISNAQFTQTNTCGAQLAASSSCTISVVFAPQLDGAQFAVLTISDSAAESPQTASLSGVGARTATVSPTRYVFPSQAIGSSSSPQSVTLTNNEAEAISISGISVSNTQFAETDTCGGSLAAGASCSIAVTFSPQNFGTQSATLTINDTAAGGPQTVGLFGSGGTAVLSPASVNFPDQAIGSSATPATLLLTNPNSIPLSISAITTSSLKFTPTTTCSANLGAGASCIIWVKFSPSSTGTQSATLSVWENGSLRQSVTLSGTGTGSVTLTPAAYTFPNLAAGAKSAPALFLLSNSQEQAVSISGISTSNPQFVEDTTCQASLAPGASCVIAVRFEPQSGGEQNATLSIVDSAFAAPQQVNLSGVAAGALAATPLSLTFTDQIIGRQSGPQTISVVNQQSTPVNITSIGSSLTQFPITTNCIPAGSSTGVLNPGAGCSISVSYLPTAAETDSGVISITNASSGSTEMILTTGTGVVEDTAPSAVIVPQSPCVLPSGTQQFQALVTNLSDTTVDWYVDGVENGSGQTGTISSQGLYTAPASAGTHTIEGISEADQGLTVSTSVKVTADPTWAAYPETVSVLTSTQQSFQGRLCEIPTPGTTWYVDKIAGGNATVGTISADGTYTAPSAPGSHTISVLLQSPKGIAEATAAVFPGVDVDFGTRESTTYPIRSGYLGAAHVDWLHNSADTGLLAASGVSTSRTYADISEIYANQSPSWSALDSSIATLQANGIHALLVVAYTPGWLQPNPNPCDVPADYVDVPPADPAIWADLAASVVAHMDSAFPGEVTDYEIWNEPDGGGFCNSSNLGTYLEVYGDAAVAMKAQAAADGVSIRVGGPASAGFNTTWTEGLLSNAATYPYMDFVSYHDYIGGGPSIDAAWDAYNGSLPLDQLTQETTPSVYLDAQKIVAAGSQPGGANTPIYVTEYNTNWQEAEDCCRNDPVYAPVWNGLFVTDLLDVAYSAQVPPPAQLIYYAGSNYPYFCLIGTWDAKMDCQYSVGSSPVPYPQYYAYQLMASPQYLDIADGGYMAAQASPLPLQAGLAVTAFYTARQDSILIVNPTGNNYTQVPVNIENSGFATPAAQLYQVVDGDSISTSSLPLTPSNTGVSATIAVPPYSLLGISITGP